MKFIELPEGRIINTSHIVMVEKLEHGALLHTDPSLMAPITTAAPYASLMFLLENKPPIDAVKILERMSKVQQFVSL